MRHANRQVAIAETQSVQDISIYNIHATPRAHSGNTTLNSMFILSTLTINRSKYLVVGQYFARGNGRLYCSGVLRFYPFSFSAGIPESLDEKGRCLFAYTISRSWMLMPWCLALPHLPSPVSDDASRKSPYSIYLNQLFQPAT